MNRLPRCADTTVDAVKEATGFDFVVAEPLKTMHQGCMVYWENGKQNGNYYNGDYIGLYWIYIGVILG